MDKLIDIFDRVPMEYRRSGQTTRLADSCIQEFFIKGYTFIKDHYPSKRADMYLLNIIRKRLKIEHNNIKFISDNQYYFNWCFIIAVNKEKLCDARKELNKQLEKRAY